MSRRLFDFLVALFALIVTWPLILLAATAIELTSSGPAFYRAKRAGQGGRPFTMYKLRTMHVGNETNNRKVTDSQDDRITSVGELLRRLKIDELPQFWNVLRGDMSIVGPRPEDWDIVNQHYTADQKRTLAVRPGITSAAEVRWYPDLTYHDPPPRGVSLQDWYLMRHLPLRLAEELHYLQNQSMLLDLKLIVQTIYRILVNSWISPRKRFVSPRGIKGSEMHADRDQPKGHHSRPQDIK